MRRSRFLVIIFLLFVSKQVFPQCTPANLLATSPLNTPGHTINTAFNATTTTTPVAINNLSNGLLNFSAAISGAATWGTFTAGNPAIGGGQIQNDATVGNYIYVQPTNAPSTTPANFATYTFNFTEALYNLSFRAAGLNNNDQIRVTAFNGVTPITINSTNFSNLDAGITVSAAPNDYILTGTSTAGGTDVNSNRATITIAGPVTRIVITSGKGNNSTSTVTLGFTSFAYTRCVTVPPDFNNTFVNTAISGNVSTNDVVPSGTQYGTATAVPGNPGGAIPSISSTGVYSFTSAVAGVFRFTVPMCPPGIVVPNCPNVPLVITVTQPNVYNNNPVANIDRATTQVNTAVILNTLSNDKAGNNSTVALNPASVTVTVAPLHGTTSVNASNGNITFTPTAAYTGFDTLTYQVCDATSPTPLCATSQQIITIQAASTANNTAASDDFNSTSFNHAVSGNVRNNDNDPQSNTQTVTAQNVTVSAGTLVLNTSGAYTFTPASGVSGPVNFPYQTCDNGTPQACTNATLYLLVFPTYTLPLDLISFTAAIANNADVKLNWVSENQVNVSRFEIERSPDGAASFIKVGEVPANNSTSGSYTFTDVNAKAFITKGYYRLKMIDIDGKVTYSKVVMVNFGNDIAADIRPTVVKAGQPISVFTGTAANRSSYSGFVYNQSGQLMTTWKTSTGGYKQIETNKLTPGAYTIKLVTNTGIITQKIIVQ